jgi:hypothetical protein
MSQVTDIIALIFDFDDTLVPDSTTKLLVQSGINADEFWGKGAKNLIQQGYDPPTAYLRLLLDNVGEGKPLGKLTNEKLRQFGSTLDTEFHTGLPQFFETSARRSRRTSRTSRWNSTLCPGDFRRFSREAKL